MTEQRQNTLSSAPVVFVRDGFLCQVAVCYTRGAGVRTIQRAILAREDPNADIVKIRQATPAAIDNQQ